MGALDYPTVPTSSQSSGLPIANGVGCSNCLVCKANWVSFLSLDGVGSTAKRNFPYIDYKCGGVWGEFADHPGFWTGKCGRRTLLVQKTLTFAEE
jgi:hypothetical protein